eukprot:TRINITY_DN1189_c0_g1_i1.p1 TRINITY_DN1189_c0_g1~~TRINITY_DN1189_c0_g1_i1.p1  ORF type:complete len:819 (-),score=170.28 TRINITY_DN1189_c0_g1_i1:189-2645(-)
MLRFCLSKRLSSTLSFCLRRKTLLSRRVVLSFSTEQSKKNNNNNNTTNTTDRVHVRERVQDTVKGTELTTAQTEEQKVTTTQKKTETHDKKHTHAEHEHHHINPRDEAAMLGVPSEEALAREEALKAQQEIEYILPKPEEMDRTIVRGSQDAGFPIHDSKLETNEIWPTQPYFKTAPNMKPVDEAVWIRRLYGKEPHQLSVGEWADWELRVGGFNFQGESFRRKAVSRHMDEYHMIERFMDRDPLNEYRKAVIDEFPVVIIGGGWSAFAAARHIIPRWDAPWGSTLIFDQYPYLIPNYLAGAYTSQAVELDVEDDGLLIKETGGAFHKPTLMPGSQIHNHKVVEVQPQYSRLFLDNGQEVRYKYLVIAAGLEPDIESVKGLKYWLGKRGICTSKTLFDAQYAKWCIQLWPGGFPNSMNAIFSFPDTPVPFLADQQSIPLAAKGFWKKHKMDSEVDMIWCTGQKNLSDCDAFDKALTKQAEASGMSHGQSSLYYGLKLIEVRAEPDKIAVFKRVLPGPQGEPVGQIVEIDFEMLHVTPPYKYPSFIAEAGLARKDGSVNVDSQTLRHVEYPNIFALGECAGLPIKYDSLDARRHQGMVVGLNIFNTFHDRPLKAYDGYGTTTLFRNSAEYMPLWYDYNTHTQTPKWIKHGTGLTPDNQIAHEMEKGKIHYREYDFSASFAYGRSPEAVKRDWMAFAAPDDNPQGHTILPDDLPHIKWLSSLLRDAPVQDTLVERHKKMKELDQRQIEIRRQERISFSMEHSRLTKERDRAIQEQLAQEVEAENQALSSISSTSATSAAATSPASLNFSSTTTGSTITSS